MPSTLKKKEAEPLERKKIICVYIQRETAVLQLANYKPTRAPSLMIFAASTPITSVRLLQLQSHPSHHPNSVQPKFLESSLPMSAFMHPLSRTSVLLTICNARYPEC